jgi:ribosome-binding factor A
MSSNRTLRVNELIQRELSNLLRRRYKDDAAPITITAVEVTPDTRQGKVFVSVTGDEEQTEDRIKWLRKHAKELRLALGEIIILKHMPVLTYEVDTVTDRGNRILGILDWARRRPITAGPAVPSHLIIILP